MLIRPVVGVNRRVDVGARRPVWFDVLMVEAMNARWSPGRHIVCGVRLESHRPLVVSTERVSIGTLVMVGHVFEFWRFAAISHVLSGGHLHYVLFVMGQVVEVGRR